MDIFFIDSVRKCFKFDKKCPVCPIDIEGYCKELEQNGKSHQLDLMDDKKIRKGTKNKMVTE